MRCPHSPSSAQLQPTPFASLEAGIRQYVHGCRPEAHPMEGISPTSITGTLLRAQEARRNGIEQVLIANHIDGALFAARVQQIMEHLPSDN